MKTYVVMNHYIHTPELVELATNALRSFGNYFVRIVSVDDNSPMDTTFIRDLSDVFINRDKNGGFAVSANDGLRWVLNNEKEDCIVVYANNDIEVKGNWLEEANRFFSMGADMVGGLGYRTKDIPDGVCTDYSIGGLYNDWMFPGGFFITKKSVLEEIGIYDENYKHGGIEDIDLFHRARLAGKKLYMTPSIKYWHKEGATRYAGEEYGKNKEAEKDNIAYFIKKWDFHPVENLQRTILQDNRFNF